MTRLSQILILLALLSKSLQAQTLTQTIRGTVVDKITQVPLPGANVVVLSVQPLMGAATDVNGNFKITGVPVGNQSIKISFIGYKDMVLPAVVVNSGKEVVLTVSIE